MFPWFPLALSPVSFISWDGRIAGIAQLFTVRGIRLRSLDEYHLHLFNNVADIDPNTTLRVMRRVTITAIIALGSPFFFNSPIFALTQPQKRKHKLLNKTRLHYTNASTQLQSCGRE